MDNLAKAKRFFEEKAYKNCGINVDALPEKTVRKMLKRILGKAADDGKMNYISACKDILTE